MTDSLKDLCIDYWPYSVGWSVAALTFFLFLLRQFILWGKRTPPTPPAPCLPPRVGPPKPGLIRIDHVEEVPLAEVRAKLTEAAKKAVMRAQQIVVEQPGVGVTLSITYLGGVSLVVYERGEMGRPVGMVEINDPFKLLHGEDLTEQRKLNTAYHRRTGISPAREMSTLERDRRITSFEQENARRDAEIWDMALRIGRENLSDEKQEELLAAGGESAVAAYIEEQAKIAMAKCAERTKQLSNALLTGSLDGLDPKFVAELRSRGTNGANHCGGVRSVLGDYVDNRVLHQEIPPADINMF